MPLKIASLFLKPRNIRVVIFSLIAGTLVVAIYFMYNGNFPSAVPTNLAPVENLVDDQSGYRIHPDSHRHAVLSEDVPSYRNSHQSNNGNPPQVLTHLSRGFNYSIPRQARKSMTCPNINPFTPIIDTTKIYPKLEFTAEWIRTREYWNPVYESRYQALKNPPSKKDRARPSHTLEAPPTLKVFVIPHSHNDPGWLKTFEGYFYTQTAQIIDNLVEKLTQFTSMKFLWSEISFLSKWWAHAHPSKRHLFKQLVASGRLEIVTGGWVMTDEATVNLYSMIDQLVEGHQWVKAHLDTVPTSSWSIDPFGHSSTFPYILKASSISSMVIQRIHFGWKKYFLDNRQSDFSWVQRWDTHNSHSIHCHNAPWDIYSIKHSCGPFPQVCLNFDFRNISGEYSENYLISAPITSQNVKQKAELMLEQYGRTASMFPHNIAMISLGDDFRFQQPIEWEQQYTNYQKLFDYINANRQVYNAEVQFGTVSDYFKAIEERGYNWPTLSGDFFVYSDIFSEGRPAYWSGYYSTRPFWKKFYRETENVLRGAEILFTFANALIPHIPHGEGEGKILNHQYEQLTIARRWLGLFAHHDATTGTSKQDTMNDYGLKLLEAYQFGIDTQIAALSVVLFGAANNSIGLRTDFELERFGELPRQLPLTFPNPPNSIKRVVLWNSLGKRRSHVAKVAVTSPNVEVIGPDGSSVVAQLNPVLELTESSMLISGSVFELTWLADLPPLSVAVYQVRMTKNNRTATSTIRSVIYCKTCHSPGDIFEINPMQTGDIQLNNERLQCLFDRDTGFLLKVSKARFSTNVQMSFGGYASIDFRSGAYLLMPDTGAEQQIPFKYSNSKIFIVSGPLYSELSVSHAPLLLSTRIMHAGDEETLEAIYFQNQVDLGRHNGEIFVRFETNVQSDWKLEGADDDIRAPAMWTDQNGFTFERRVKVDKVRYEGNTYPVNTMAYLQDDKSRVTLMVDRSHGCTSMEVGRLECMIERRTIFDDSRGMGEGVTDNRPTISNYVLLVEELSHDGNPFQKELPTLQAHRLSQELSYPSFMYLYDDDKLKPVGGTNSNGQDIVGLLNQKLPCDVNLINLRTTTDGSLDYDLNLPSKKALLIVQRVGYHCGSKTANLSCSPGEGLFLQGTEFNGVGIADIQQTDLTGVSSKQYNNHSHKNYTELSQVRGKPFEITSVIVTFN